MKRTRTTILVSYGESSSSENERHPSNERPKSPLLVAPPPPKKRKLLVLPAYLAPGPPRRPIETPRACAYNAARRCTMGCLRLCPSRAAWCAQVRRRMCHGHREQRDGDLDEHELACAWRRGFWSGRRRNGGRRARVAHLDDLAVFSAHKSEGGYEARGERCCQGPFSEHVFPRCGSPMQRCPLPHLMLS